MVFTCNSVVAICSDADELKRVNNVKWCRFTYDRIYYNDFPGHENYISERAKTESFHSALFNVV